MSDETTSPAEAEPAPRVRRISNKNPKKSPKPTKPAKEEQTPEQAVPVEEFDSTPPTGDDAKEENPETSGDAKRKNRRRRGKGKSSQKDGEPSPEDASVSEEIINLADADSKEANKRQGGHKDQQNLRPPQKQRTKLDSEKVAKNAWKIFLAEVSEEGVALIGDNDARELARRCFRLSEIFLEEESRRN